MKGIPVLQFATGSNAMLYDTYKAKYKCEDITMKLRALIHIHRPFYLRLFSDFHS